MNKRGSFGIPMHERARLGREPAAAPAPVDDCPARHCWVADAADQAGVKRPGLLLEWRQTTSGAWEGRVAYAAALRAETWALVEEWVPGDRLSPG